MAKLIPFSKEMQKKMGIVSTKKGLMIAAPKKAEKIEKKVEKKEEKSEKVDKFAKPQVQTVVVVQQKPSKKEETKRLQDRGIF